MASIVLAAAGASIGAGFGGTILGLSGAVIGQAAGSIIGTIILASALVIHITLALYKVATRATLRLPVWQRPVPMQSGRTSHRPHTRPMQAAGRA